MRERNFWDLSRAVELLERWRGLCAAPCSSAEEDVRADVDRFLAELADTVDADGGCPNRRGAPCLDPACPDRAALHAVVTCDHPEDRRSVVYRGRSRCMQCGAELVVKRARGRRK